MKIYLFLSNRLLSFFIPSKVNGSFSFDENEEEDSKLININAIEQQWYLCSNEDVKVIMNGVEVNNTVLTNQYYILRRNGLDYLIYVTNFFDESFVSYNYNELLNLNIGKTETCNLKFNLNLLSDEVTTINYNEGKLVLNSKEKIYLNNKLYEQDENNKTIINTGDEIDIYGLKIIIFDNFIMINNPLNLVTIDNTTNLSRKEIIEKTDYQNLEIKDVDLYNKSSYFSKSPRIRRLIKTKNIEFSEPPKLPEDQKMPLLLTIGPMFTMVITSGITVVNTLTKISNGQTTYAQSWPSLVAAGVMVISTMLWPLLSKSFTKKMQKKAKANIIKRYDDYLNGKKMEFLAEYKLQSEITLENVIPVSKCLEIISGSKVNFWDKRIEQNDFLDFRIGVGNRLLDVNVEFPKQGFTIDEDELKNKAQSLVDEYKYIKNVPVSYSFSQNLITAMMGEEKKCYGMINNILLQLITFYSYEDVKIVVFTNKSNENNWKYIKYLNHNFSNSKNIRFFSSDAEHAKTLCDYLNNELQNRISSLSETESKTRIFKPHYFIITDDYTQIKRNDFIRRITEIDANIGFNLVILEKKLSRLPSKCFNFINLRATESGVLKNSFESQESENFVDEIDYSIDMMNVARHLSNIPIEFEEGIKQLPDSISFLEMEKVGKVEQLNIMNRWDTNDSTASLKSEIGVDADGNLMYLDLHEKFHGPHGLIAGMTGSGKSEFIITYILSMAMNYSPDDVAFILIDYKGGGLAYAFENKTTGVVLPHLAGTITNLDKAEMDRTLVSIDSEIKRRQSIFNQARDALGESTIDIYKYQRHFHEGKLKEPIPHLFIICDEFAELKSQQPDFMDNLISVARIGRSLGVHLILATQKPSGVVNDQIWSNTKFRVCLKVQDESDSKEMLKRPEAASIRQAGRYYLQVGFNEIFELGQSGWCGAKYYPSEKIIKQVDKSINFIDDTGNIIKSVQATSNNTNKTQAQGEQLAAVMKNIIEVANTENKKARRLWLTDIDPIILVNNLEKKYNYTQKLYDVCAIVGEYDAPEKQEQGLLIYSLKQNGNTLIYGNDEIERENLLNIIIYSACRWHSSQELNVYIIDYGSEELRMFNNFPQIGGMVFMGEDEKFKNLFKMLNDEIKYRKKVLIEYAGNLDNYNARNQVKLPQILFIINNYEGLLESYQNIYEDIASMARDCERYGIYIIMTASSLSSTGRKIMQNFNNFYALHLSDATDYFTIFNMKVNSKPKDVLGRGVALVETPHIFQTASIVDENNNISSYLENYANQLKQSNKNVAPRIPTLPDKVTLDIIEPEILNVNAVPIGIYKDSLRTTKYDFLAFRSTVITGVKLANLNSFVDSLLDAFLRIQGLAILFVDASKELPSVSTKTFKNRKIDYFNSNFDEVIKRFNMIVRDPNNSKYKILFVLYGIDKLKSSMETNSLTEFLDSIKKTENCSVIICDSGANIRSFDSDSSYSKIKNNADGIWVGKGFGDQSNFRISKVTKEMSADISLNYGYVVKENEAKLVKLLEFNDMIKEDSEDEK